MVALAAAILLVAALGAARAQERAFTVGFTGEETSTSQIERGLADARAARRLAPDASAKLLEWQILRRDGRRARADALLREVVRLEPENYDAWLYLSRTTRDARLARRAKARVAELGIAR